MDFIKIISYQTLQLRYLGTSFSKEHLSVTTSTLCRVFEKLKSVLLVIVHHSFSVHNLVMVSSFNHSLLPWN